MAPALSVVVMTFNRPDALLRCLHSLARQSVSSDAFEVVVVDVSDAPIDDLEARFAGRLQLRHQRAANRGVAVNRNVGARAARGRWLVYIDDDCVAQPDWLAKLHETIERCPEAMIGGGVINLLGDNVIALAGQLITDAVDRHFNPNPHDATFVPGLNFAVPRDAYLADGGCDEGFGMLAAEDRDLCRRWRRDGRRIVKASSAIVAHQHRDDLRGFARQYFNYGRGAWVYHRRIVGAGDPAGETVVGSHLELLRHVGRAVAAQPARLRAKLLALVVVWEVANAAGFLWQASVARLRRRR